ADRRADGGTDRRTDASHGLPPEGRVRTGDTAHGAWRDPGAGGRARRRGVADPAAAASSAARAALLVDRPHGAAVADPVGDDRLGTTRMPRLDPPLDRLPVAHRGRADPVRRSRRAISLWVADPAGVRPPLPHPRDAQGHGA